MLRGVLHHVGEQLAHQAIVHQIDLVVAAPDRHRLVGIALDIGIERVLHHALHELAHARDGMQRPYARRLLGEPMAACGDALGGVVADALEIVRDLHRHGDQPQVDGDRLAGREHADRELIDLLLERIDRIVALDDLVGEVDIAGDQRLDAAADLVLDQAAHLEDLARQVGDFLIVGFDGVISDHATSHSLSRTGR